MNIKKIISLTLSLLFIISTLAGCRKVNSDMSSGNTSDISSTVYGVVDIEENENNENSETSSDETTTSKENQSDASSGDSTTSSTNSYVDNIVSIDDDGDTSGPATFVEETEDTNTSDGISSGTTKKTYKTSTDENGKVKTVEIEAGSSVYYKIKGASNKYLTINSANAYVIYENTKYTAKDGVVSFFVASDLLASDQVFFEIGNSGSKNESFTIQFTSAVGSQDNPEKITSVNSKYTTDIAEGNEQGYFYSYTATSTGKIRFYILSDASTGKLQVNRLIDPAAFVIQQRSTTETEENYVKTDSVGTYVEFDVKSGEEFTINVAPNTTKLGSYPAVTVEWKIVYN